MGGEQHIIIYAKLHVVCQKALQKTCVFPIWFCFAYFYGYVFFENKDLCKNSHKLHHVFSSSNGLVSRSKGHRKLALQQPYNSCRRNIRWAGGFFPMDEGVHPWKMRIFWPPQKEPGKGGNSNVFEDGSPRKLGNHEHPF